MPTTDKRYLVATDDGPINGSQFRTQATTDAGKVWGIDTDGTTKLLDGAGNFVPLDKSVSYGETRAGLYTLVGADSTTKVFANIRFLATESPNGSDTDLFTVYVNRIDSSVGSMLAIKADSNKVYNVSMSSGTWNAWTEIGLGGDFVEVHQSALTGQSRASLFSLVGNMKSKVFPSVVFTAGESPSGSTATTYVVYVTRKDGNNGTLLAIGSSNALSNCSVYGGTWAWWVTFSDEKFVLMSTASAGSMTRYGLAIGDKVNATTLHTTVNFTDAESPTHRGHWYNVTVRRTSNYIISLLAYNTSDGGLGPYYCYTTDGGTTWSAWTTFNPLNISGSASQALCRNGTNDGLVWKDKPTIIYSNTEPTSAVEGDYWASTDNSDTLLGSDIQVSATDTDDVATSLGKRYTKDEVYTKTESEARYQYKISSVALSLTYTSGWSADTSSRYVNRCYKITDNLYYICIFIKCSTALTADASYTPIDGGGLTMGGKVPQVCTLTAVDRASQRAIGCWINYAGKVYLSPTAAVSAGAGICICGVVHTP